MITRKRRTREHIIADLSVNHVERQVLLCGHTVEEVGADYGYDLFLFSFDNQGEAEAGYIAIQVASATLIFLPLDEPLPFTSRGMMY